MSTIKNTMIRPTTYKFTTTPICYVWLSCGVISAILAAHRRYQLETKDILKPKIGDMFYICFSMYIHGLIGSAVGLCTPLTLPMIFMFGL